MPSINSKLPEQTIVTFEMLPIDTITNILNVQSQNEKIIENEDAKKVEKSKATQIIKEEPEQTKIAEPEVQKEEKSIVQSEPQVPEPVLEPILEPEKIEVTKPEPEQIKTPESEPEPKVKKEEKPVAPIVQVQNPVKKPEIKKTVPIIVKEIKKKKINSSDLDSLLKNLEQSSQGNNNKSKKYTRSQQNKDEQESKGQYKENLTLSINERALIKQQIEKQWNIQIGAKNIEQVKIVLYIALNKNGSISIVKVQDAICPNIPQSSCQIIIDSAIRAVQKASPIENLDPMRYDSWKEFNFLFDPSDLLR
jgi:hypothetical protein